jgi:NADH-quinone oxidoreductase subunit K
MIPLSWYLILSAILFSLGVFGFLLKRNIITIFMSIELMLNAVNLSFVAFANYWNSNPAKLASGAAVVPLSGQVFVFFVMVVAAAEAAVGLAIIISVYRTRETLNVDQVNLLKL